MSDEQDDGPEDEPADELGDELDDDGELGDGVVLLPVNTVFPLSDGSYLIAVPDILRELLAEQLRAIRTMLLEDETDPTLVRLFPTAYPHDAEAEDEYQRLMRSDLISSRLAAFDTVEQTLQSTTVSEEELQQWLHAVNAVRLVLGMLVGIDSDEFELELDDPRYPTYELYNVFTTILSSIYRALRAGGALDRT